MKRQTYTILIADDDSDDRALIQIAFAQVSDVIKVQFVASGEEAMAYLRGTGRFADRAAYEYPSFLITDLKMADGDGFEVLNFLRGTPEFAITPVVVMSGSNDESDVEKAYVMGAVAYLAKPSGLTELRQMVKLLADFWMMCEVPGVDSVGRRNISRSTAKLGAQFDEQRPRI